MQKQAQHGATWDLLAAASHQVGPNVDTIWVTLRNTKLHRCSKHVGHQNMGFQADFAAAELLPNRSKLGMGWGHVSQNWCPMLQTYRSCNMPVTVRVSDLPRGDAVLILSWFCQGNLVKRSCQGDVFRWLVQRSCQLTEMFHKDLPKGSPVETLRRDLAQRSLAEIFLIDLLWRPCAEIFLADLV